MADVTTNFPPQTYSSTFFLNTFQDDDKAIHTKKRSKVPKQVNSDSAPLLDCFARTMKIIPIPIQLTIISLLNFSLNAAWMVHWNDSADNKTCPQGTIEREKFKDNQDFNKRSGEIVYETYIISFEKLEETISETYFKNPAFGLFVEYLDLSGHNIKLLATKVLGNNFPCVRMLNLSRNSLDSIREPMTLSDLINLDTLDLSYNKLRSISKFTFAQLVYLLRLDLSHNSIESIDVDAFEDLANLQVLRLNHNFLTKISPSLLFFLRSLEKLHLQNNAISALSNSSFTSSYTLTELNLSKNKITALLNYTFTGAAGLSELDLSFNNISFIEHNAFKLSSIKSLKMSHNALNHTVLPSLWGVEKLDLSFNNFTEFPKTSLNLFQNLKALNLAGNFLQKFFLQTKSINVELKELNLSSNYIMETNFTQVLKGLVTLDLSDNLIREDVLASFSNPFSPKSSDYYLNLTYVDLSYNLIQKIDIFPFMVGLNLLRILKINNNLLKCSNVEEVSYIAGGNYVIKTSVFGSEGCLTFREHEDVELINDPIERAVLRMEYRILHGAILFWPSLVAIGILLLGTLPFYYRVTRNFCKKRERPEDVAPGPVYYRSVAGVQLPVLVNGTDDVSEDLDLHM